MTLVENGAASNRTLAERYGEGERALDGACPLDYLADGGYCAPIGRPWMQLLADDECIHGRLPGDRTEACGCWPSELPPRVTPVAPIPYIDLTPKEPLMLTAAPERVALPADPRMRNYRAMEPSKLAACLRELENGTAIIDGDFTMDEHLAAARDAAAKVAPFGFKKDGTPRKSRAGRPRVTHEPVPVAAPDLAEWAAEVSAMRGQPDIDFRRLATLNGLLKRGYANDPRADELRAQIHELVLSPLPVAPAAPATPVAHLTTDTLLGKIVADIDAEIARLQAARDALAVIG